MTDIRVFFFVACAVLSAAPAWAGPYGSLNGAFEVALVEEVQKGLRLPGTLADRQLNPFGINPLQVNSPRKRLGTTPFRLVHTTQRSSGGSQAKFEAAPVTRRSSAKPSMHRADEDRTGLIRLVRSPASGVWSSISPASPSDGATWKIVRRPNS